MRAQRAHGRAGLPHLGFAHHLEFRVELLLVVGGAADLDDVARHVIKVCGTADYKQKLDAELKVMRESEMWQAGAAVRALRPHEKAKANADKATGVKGRGAN